MKAATSTLLQQKIRDLRSLPAMPSVLQSLGECLTGNAENVNIDRVVELISYDKSIAAQCLRMANSALFRRRTEVESLRSAVLSLGVWRIRDLVYSCALPKLLSAEAGMPPVVFWRHALGTALVSQHLAQRLRIANSERFYLAGLLHDLGILVNALLFRDEFQRVLQRAEASAAPLYEVEMQVLGFSHCESGRILADQWKLPEDISGVIEFHHQPLANGRDDAELACTVYLADLLCRLRGLGYGYYEAREFDLAAEPPWRMLAEKYPAAATLDLALFTFELDEQAVQVRALVDAIFSGTTVAH